MKSLASRITSKGQTTIPAEIRKSLGLQEGDLLFYEVDEDHLVRIRKLENKISNGRGRLNRLCKSGKGAMTMICDQFDVVVVPFPLVIYRGRRKEKPW